MRTTRNYGVEQLHLLRRTPRSYDMTRTHIMHGEANRHVDVTLRCAPKNWKRKKVKVRAVNGDRQNNCIQIRNNAKSGYIAVKKRANSAYEGSRNCVSDTVANVYPTVVKYDRASTAGERALKHDFNRELSAMSDRSHRYIEQQLDEASRREQDRLEQERREQEQSEAEAAQADYNDSEAQTQPPAQPDEIQEPALRFEENPDFSRDEQYNPYVSNYSRAVSNEEFHELMDSLQKSLDDAYERTIGFAQPDDTSNELEDDFGFGENAASAENEQPQTSSSAAPSNDDDFSPVDIFSMTAEQSGIRPDFATLRDENSSQNNSQDDEVNFNAAAPFIRESIDEEDFSPVTKFSRSDDENDVVDIDVNTSIHPNSAFLHENAGTASAQSESDEQGYNPMSVLPNENYSFVDTENGYSVEEVYDDSGKVKIQKFFVNTGNKLKSFVGIIRNAALGNHDDEDEYVNENVDITYSDDDYKN